MVCNRDRRGGKPQLSLSVEPLEDDRVDLFGKVASDLQDDIIIEGNAIAGTLKYVADYSSAYGPGEDSGNYIVLKIESEEGAVITGEVVGGVHGPVTLDEDGILISRITDKDSQTIKIVASVEGGGSVTKIFSLSELDCEES